MRVTCPFCGPRSVEEFTYIHEAATQFPPLDTGTEPWVDALYLRHNTAGPTQEIWHHVHGCRGFLVVDRDTLKDGEVTARLVGSP